jgi:hypothetical protein
MEKQSIDQYETRRKFLGASIERLAVRYIGCTARTYANWVKHGTSMPNLTRIEMALREFARRETKP